MDHPTHPKHILQTPFQYKLNQDLTPSSAAAPGMSPGRSRTHKDHQVREPPEVGGPQASTHTAQRSCRALSVSSAVQTEHFKLHHTSPFSLQYTYILISILWADYPVVVLQCVQGWQAPSRQVGSGRALGGQVGSQQVGGFQEGRLGPHTPCLALLRGWP